jgi:hypothetical protein
MSASVETPHQDAIESLVVADLGRGSTRAFLLERIAGSFRFVAKAEGPTTADGPIEDLTVGWQRLLRQLEWDAGRRLAEANGLLMPQQERGDGVDSLIVCSTLAAPLRVAVLEVGGNPVSSTLLEALKRTYARLSHVVVPGRTKDTNWVSGQAEALRRFRPEVVVLLVGDDDAALPRLDQLLRQTVAEVAMSLASTWRSSSPIRRCATRWRRPSGARPRRATWPPTTAPRPRSCRPSSGSCSTPTGLACRRLTFWRSPRTPPPRRWCARTRSTWSTATSRGPSGGRC